MESILVPDPERLVATLGPSAGLTGLAWCGERLLSLDSAGELQVLGAEGELIQAPRRAPGGSALCAAGQGALVGAHKGLWWLPDLDSDLVPIEGPKGELRALAWVQDHGFAAGDEGVLWGVNAAGAATALSAPGPQVQRLAASSDRVYTVDALGELKTWDHQGQLLRTQTVEDHGPLAAHEGMLLYASGPRLVLEEQDQVREAEVGSATLALAWTGEVWLSVHRDQSLRRWSPSLEVLGQEPLGHRRYVSALAVDGEKLASGSGDRSLRIWPRTTRPALPSGVLAVGVGLGQLLTVDLNGVCRWDTERGVPGERRNVDARAAAPGPNGALFYATLSGSLFRLEPGQDSPSAEGRAPAPVSAMAFHHGALLLRCGEQVLAVDPLTLSPLGPGDSGAVPEARGHWWCWEEAGSPRRALFLQGEHLALWADGVLRLPEALRPYLRLAQGFALRSL